MDGWYRITTCASSGYALSAAAAPNKNGVNACVQALAGSANQVFHITRGQGGFYSLRCANGGRAIDLDGGKVISGVNVQLWSYGTTNRNQQWAIYDQGGGELVLRNVGSGLVLDLSGGRAAAGRNVQGYMGNGSAAQRWRLHRMGEPGASLDVLANNYMSEVVDGTYIIHSALDERMALDVSGGSAANGAKTSSSTRPTGPRRSCGASPMTRGGTS